jgi:predicted dithiol-disulfide oxidoreductase (DUF899 family)
MSYRETSDRLAEYRRQIADLRVKMREAQASVDPEPIREYEFSTSGGSVRLSELFGDKEYLFMIHNMGTSCPNCTLWADGYNGIYDHLANRAAFIVSSPDPPEIQRTFAKDRGWRFRMVSHRGTTFAADMGYRSANGSWLPGISVFRRERGRILRVSDAGFNIGDDFCALWHILDLLPEGAGAWRPQFSYE